MSRSRRSVAVLAASAATAAMLVTTGPAAAAPVPCGTTKHLETIQLRTFKIQMDVKGKIYKVGDVVQVKVRVTRPGEEDPLGLGQPIDSPHEEPAQGVGVGVGLSIRRVFLPGFAETDENGEATIRIKIEDWVRPGWVDVDAYAWERQVDSVCFTVEENGYRHEDRMFKVVL